MSQKNISARSIHYDPRCSALPALGRGRRTPTLVFSGDKFLLRPGYVLIEVETKANFRLLDLAETLDTGITERYRERY